MGKYLRADHIIGQILTLTASIKSLDEEEKEKLHCELTTIIESDLDMTASISRCVYNGIIIYLEKL